VNPKTPFPQGGPIPEPYAHMSDQFVCLSMAAANTSKLKLATGITLVPEHNPIVHAKQIATLDYFSGGRVIYGIGAGWLREESELLGADFPRRWTQTGEYIAAMRELWTKPEASFEGKYVKFPPVRSFPKPIQQPGPPVLLGSKDKNALKRVAKWGDGWCPNRIDPPYMKENLARLKDECRTIGRDYNKLDITVMGAVSGERNQVQDELHRFEELGVGRFVAATGMITPQDYKQKLEHYARLYL
ncbi:MAG TPA: TIGR03619 family F420-dependent LLM class oxidoreductase, partial [Candidatus Binataceae bacterium]|nr:TIGR03619 family F420-dependent LLM class oxidoreductase [Candidatus Binataceae bacterium]